MDTKKKYFRTLRTIKKVRFLLTQNQLKTIVNSLVVSCLDYCNGLYYGIREELLHQLQLIQNAASKLVMGKYKHDHIEDDIKTLHWLTVKKRIIFKLALLVHKSLNGLAPSYLQDLLQLHYASSSTSVRLNVPRTNSSYGSRAFSVIGPKIYNSLPLEIKECTDIIIFKKKLKTYLFKKHELELIFNSQRSMILGS